MLVDDCVAVPVAAAGRIGEARRLAAAVAARLGFDETERGKVARIAGEAASAVSHTAAGGAVFVRPLESAGAAGIEILALGAASQDDVGEIARLSAFFDFMRGPEVGTALLSRLWATPPSPRLGADLELGVVSAPRAGEEICGDAWGTAHPPGRAVLALAGGGGCGPASAKASREAIRIVQESAARTPGEIVQSAQRALRRAPGASLAVVSIDFEARRLRLAATGLVHATLVRSDASERLVGPGRLTELEQAWPEGALVVLHTDGVSDAWSLGAYPDLARHSPSLVAGVLYRDFGKHAEDATVVVAAEARGAA